MSLQLPQGVPDKDVPPAFPGDVTYYFPIDLGGKTGLDGSPVTGVFLPEDYSYSDPIDVVLFFHGDKQRWSTIWDYWKPQSVHDIALRQAVNEAGKPTVLIAPTLGSNPGWSGAMTGSLDERGADDLLDAAAQFLHINDPHYSARPPDIGRIVLAAHSGGGQTMLRQTMLMKKYVSNIRACWGFDCTYSFSHTRPNADNWIKWAMLHLNVEHHFYYKTGTGTAAVAVAIDEMASGKAPLPHMPKDTPVFRKLPNVQVHGSGREHYPQLNHNFPLRMASDSFLNP